MTLHKVLSIPKSMKTSINSTTFSVYTKILILKYSAGLLQFIITRRAIPIKNVCNSLSIYQRNMLNIKN